MPLPYTEAPRYWQKCLRPIGLRHSKSFGIRPQLAQAADIRLSDLAGGNQNLQTGLGHPAGLRCLAGLQVQRGKRDIMEEEIDITEGGVLAKAPHQMEIRLIGLNARFLAQLAPHGLQARLANEAAPPVAAQQLA